MEIPYTGQQHEEPTLVLSVAQNETPGKWTVEPSVQDKIKAVMCILITAALRW
jgi:hypothetical protein